MKRNISVWLHFFDQTYSADINHFDCKMFSVPIFFATFSLLIEFLFACLLFTRVVFEIFHLKYIADSFHGVNSLNLNLKYHFFVLLLFWVFVLIFNATNQCIVFVCVLLCLFSGANFFALLIGIIIKTFLLIIKFRFFTLNSHRKKTKN